MKKQLLQTIILLSILLLTTSFFRAQDKLDIFLPFAEDAKPQNSASLSPLFEQNALPVSFNADSTSKKIDIYIVHGTFAANFSWHKPGGNFYESVLSVAKDKFGKDNVNVISFQWTGYLGSTYWIEASTSLARAILNSQNTVYAIGHSHGGTVIALASILLEMVINDAGKGDLSKKIDALSQTLLLQIQSEDEKWRKGFSLTRSQQEIEGQLEEIKTILTDNLLKMQKNYEILSLTKYRFPSNSPNIEAAWFLATPTSQSLIPSNKSIKQIFSLFSKTDFIQTVFGLFGRTYDVSRKILLNISAAFCSEKLIRYFPTHSDMHSPTIGRSLFLLTEACGKCCGDDLLSSKPLEIMFFENGKMPIISIQADIKPTIFEIWISNLRELLSFF